MGLALLGRLRLCLLCRSLGPAFRLLAFFLLLGAAFVGGHYHEHGAAFHLRWDLDRGDIGQSGGDLFQIFERDLGVIHLTAAELDRHTNFVSLQQPAAGIVHLETTVRFIGLGTQADFLDFDLGLRLFGFAFFLGALINELAIIDDTADRWSCVWRYFNQIQFGVACDLQGLAYRYNTDVAAIRPDQADLRDADALIYSKVCSADKFLLIQTVDQPLAGFLADR